MLKRFRTVFTLLLVFGLSAALMGDEPETTQYFPNTLGSYWVYVDQDGNELTRRVVEGEEIAEKIYHGFEYEPALEDGVDYDYHIHPNLYQVGEEWVTFWVRNEAEEAIKARLAREMETFVKMMERTAQAEAEAGFELLYEVEAEAQDPFYVLPTSGTSDEEWDAMQIKAKITMKPDPPQGDPEEVIFEFTIVEKGKVLGADSIKTLAGTFENCLKIEYRTYTGVATFPDEVGNEFVDPPGESVTTLWVAPNVGIVKFHQETENIFLKIVPIPEVGDSTAVKTLELKKYEIKGSFDAVLMRDEPETTQYFSGTPGSYWIYEDQDGSELTRRAIEGEEIAEEVYHAFSYEPALEDGVDYDYHIHPNLYKVGEEWVTFMIDDETEKAVQARLAEEMGVFLEMMKAAAPPEAVAGFNLLYVIAVEAQDEFYVLPTSVAPNEKWDAMKIKAKITFDSPQEDFEEATVEFTIVEEGKVLGTENVETPTGTFENCLKVEYRTETTVAMFPPEEEVNPPGESVTTLWVAPDVGIVKFHQEAEDIFLKIVPVPEIKASTTVKTLELKKYEIESTDSEADKSD